MVASLFVHVTKNKLADSNLNQYTNVKRLGYSMNSTQPRKGNKYEAVHGQQQFAGEPFPWLWLSYGPLFFNGDGHPDPPSNTT
jgi:hypothetical protein